MNNLQEDVTAVTQQIMNEDDWRGQLVETSEVGKSVTPPPFPAPPDITSLYK